MAQNKFQRIISHVVLKSGHSRVTGIIICFTHYNNSCHNFSSYRFSLQCQCLLQSPTLVHTNISHGFYIGVRNAGLLTRYGCMYCIGASCLKNETLI